MTRSEPICGHSVQVWRDISFNSVTGMEAHTCLEIDPSKYIIVAGPSFASRVLDEVHSQHDPNKKRRIPEVTSAHILRIGIQILLETESCSSQAEKARRETLYRNAYELDPLFAMRKLSSTLQKCNQFDEWLKRSFEYDLHQISDSPSLCQIRKLQERGTLLVYTHYDDVLSRVSNTQPVLLSDTSNFNKWANGEMQGVLHVHGIYSEPATVTFDCDVYDTPNHPTADKLQQLFVERHVILIGFDQEKHSVDPILARFTEKYISSASVNHRTIHLTRALEPADFSCVNINITISNSDLNMPAAQQQHTSACVHPLAETSHSLWKQIEFDLADSGDHLMLSLVVVGKQGARDISKMLTTTPGVNFALVSSAMYGGNFVYTVCLRVERTRQRDMWNWLFQERAKLISNGLLAIVLESGTFIWINGRPKIEPSTAVVGSKASTEPVSDTETALQETLLTRAHHLENGHSRTRFESPANEWSPSLSSASLSEFRFPKNGIKKVPRYTVHKFKVKGGSHQVSFSNSPSMHKVTREQNDASSAPRSAFERRCSLPVNIPDPYGSSQALKQFNHRLSTLDPLQEPPTYTAIKMAMLCHQYKRRPSVQSDPKTLKCLLRSKLSPEPVDLLKLRRYSDPGYHTKLDGSFARRKELFIDENATWSNTYGSVIQKRILKWQTQREERRQSVFAWQKSEYPVEIQGLKYPLLNSHPQGNGIPTTVSGVNGQNVFPSTIGSAGLNSYVYSSQAVVNPVGNGSGLASSMLYSPYVSPYTLINPYQQVVRVGQPATYYLPQSTMQDNQTVLYLVPPTNDSVKDAKQTSDVSSTNAMMTRSLNRNISNMMAPHDSPHSLKRKVSDSDAPEGELKMSVDMYNRRHSVPNNLSFLISPVSKFNGDIGSPPSGKKMRLTEDITSSPLHSNHYYNSTQDSQNTHSRITHPRSTHSQSTSSQSSQSPEQHGQLSSIQHHLLQVHRSNRHTHQQYRARDAVQHSPLGSPQGSGQGSEVNKFYQLMQQNGDDFDSDEFARSESDEREIENIIGGAVVSANQSSDYGVSSSHSQLQLWQFLLELLLISANTHLIQWLNNDFEFRINKPGDVAKLWGKVTNNDKMDYKKLVRGLRYYFSKGIMSEVQGRKHSFKYNGSIMNYIKMRLSSNPRHEEIVVME